MQIRKTEANETTELSNKFLFKIRKQVKYEKTHEPNNFKKNA